MRKKIRLRKSDNRRYQQAIKRHNWQWQIINLFCQFFNFSYLFAYVKQKFRILAKQFSAVV